MNPRYRAMARREDAKESLEKRVKHLEMWNPYVPAPRKEGLEEMLTIHGVGISAEQKRHSVAPSLYNKNRTKNDIFIYKRVK